MIEFLTGQLIQAEPGTAVIQTGGIGWSVLITLSAYDKLPAPGEPHTLPTYLAVKEDSLTLYGFVDTREREIFEKLLTISGIGPKLAMTALSGLPSEELARAISQGDTKRLNAIPGIGKKMAERMVVELKDKLDPGETLPGSLPEGSPDKQTRDAVLALVALGYKQQEARKLIQKVPQEEISSCEPEELVRKALQAR